MGRFFRWLNSLFHRFMDKVEDPDILLDQAKREMSQTLAQNRERAVQAITQRNLLQQQYDDLKGRSQKLEQQATLALQQGNRDLARQLVREKATNDATIASLEKTLANAQQAVEAIKLAIKRQEDEVRKRTAEALAAKAQWKQAQIQNSIAKALEGMTFENEYESSYSAAMEKIKSVSAEAEARNEMLGQSLQGKILEMEDKSIDMEAEAELQKLEERLGMRPVTATTETQQVQPVVTGGGSAEEVAIPESTVDAELEELERRLGGGGNGNPQ
jgi:phage shock protein A